MVWQMKKSISRSKGAGFSMPYHDFIHSNVVIVLVATVNTSAKASIAWPPSAMSIDTKSYGFENLDLVF